MSYTIHTSGLYSARTKWINIKGEDMQITSLTWILTLILIASDILIHRVNNRSKRKTDTEVYTFDEHVQGDLAVLLRRN